MRLQLKHTPTPYEWVRLYVSAYPVRCGAVAALVLLGLAWALR